MALTLEQARKLKSTGVLITIGIFLGILYPVFSDGLGSIYPYINGIVIGVLLALLFSFYEFILFSGSIKKLKFYKIFLIRVILYSLTVFGTIFLVLVVYRMLYYDLNFYAVLKSDEFNTYLVKKDFNVLIAYTLGIITIVNFTMQMNRKMGQGVLWSFITGAYYHPREVERIIMFISIKDAKHIIEKLGRLKYHKYLKEIHFDITDSIIYHKGEIYEYVDNDVVVIWRKSNGMEQANCIRLFFFIRNKIDAEKIKYFEKYGVIPRFHASLHMGTLIRGEIGDVKSEIRYSGDAMNTTARILGQTTGENEFLISSNLLNKLELPILYEASHFAEVKLKGKENILSLHSVREAEVKTY